MNCILYKDFTRECIAQIEIYPQKISTEIVSFCTSEKHKGCPFFKMLIVKKNVCKNINKCSAFKNFQIGGFDKFAEVSNQYCTSENHKNCQRFIVKDKEGEVPAWLHPDGRRIRQWEKSESN